VGGKFAFAQRFYERRIIYFFAFIFMHNGRDARTLRKSVSCPSAESGARRRREDLRPRLIEASESVVCVCAN
jgi:hypothetical protein